MTPYYDEDGITIYHGDCRDVLPNLDVDLVLTDPPWGAQIAEWDSEWTDWFEHIVEAPTVGIIPGVMNLGKMGPTFGQLPYRWTLSAHLVNSTPSPFGLAYWNPCVVYADRAVSLHRGQPDSRVFSVRWHDRFQGHPSPKPLNVMRWFLESLPGEIACDPFMGSGTTLQAARDLGRHAIGIELEERYCEIAVQRLAQQVFAFD